VIHLQDKPLTPLKNGFRANREIDYNPLYYFAIFLVANFLLAYSHLPFLTKVWIFLMGIILPLGFSLTLGPPRVSMVKTLQEDYFPRSPALWLWGSLIAGALFLRFNGLVSLPVWPMWDDGLNSCLSIFQMEKWRWHLWYGSEKVGPITYWSRALFFRLFTPSLQSLWLFQALQSVAVLAAGYWASRQYFSNTNSFVYLSLLAFGFWTIFLGQFCAMEDACVVWELLSLGIFGLYLKSSQKSSAKGLIFGLGLWLGLGLYIWIVTLPVVLIVTCGVLWDCLQGREKKPKIFFIFIAPLLLLTGPAIPELLKNFFGGHLSSYLGLSQNGWGSQLVISLSYLTVFLWGPLDKPYFNFGPLWGGYLNPFLGAAFLLGLIQIFRVRKKPFFYGALFIFLVGLAPGVFSKTLEMMRVVTLMPFFLVVVVLGIQEGLGAFAKEKRMGVLAVFFAFSLPLDLYHLWGPYHQWAIPGKHSIDSKSPENHRAFLVLQKISADLGPGLIFTDFHHDVFDQSLVVSTYGFNAARNGKLSPRKARWAAILLSPYDQSILLKCFPGAVFHDLSSGLGRSDGGKVLALISILPENQETFLKWVPLHKAIQDIYPEIPYHVYGASYNKVLSRLWPLYPDAARNPFLRACVLEKIMKYLGQNEDLTLARPLLEIPIRDIQCPEIFRSKYALVFHRMGVSLTSQKDYSRAREAFARAAHMDPGYDLKKVLRRLEKIRRSANER
jgi:hypothetical protein